VGEQPEPPLPFHVVGRRNLQLLITQICYWDRYYSPMSLEDVTYSFDNPALLLGHPALASSLTDWVGSTPMRAAADLALIMAGWEGGEVL
jgi:hypothetical protein